jgi:fructose transport system substrate-binding protein
MSAAQGEEHLMSHHRNSGEIGRPRARLRRHTAAALTVVAAVAVAMTVAACGSSGSSSTSGGGSKVAVALVLKTFTNPYFVTMKQDAQAEATKQGVALTVTAGQTDGDTSTQIASIENAISAGAKGILITPNGPAVTPAIQKARAAGIEVIALDTVPTPPSTVNITYATDNTQAGRLIGQWTAAQLHGKPAVIAMLDLFNNQVVSVDLNRDHGFLEGMGINPGNLAVNGGEKSTGKYSGGTYTIACHQPTQGAIDGGRTAMETCLSKNPNINVVYSINEPAGIGASNALTAAGKKGVTIVSIDGGCTGVNEVKKGVIGATSQQYPGKMAALGVDAIKTLATTKVAPTVSAGLNFHNTGVTLVTDKPVAGLSAVSSTQGATTCWGPIA